MSAWHRQYTAEVLNRELNDGLQRHLEIEVDSVGEGSVTASLQVDERVLQPAGILHGGATLALAETVGSIASNMVVDRERYLCVGMEINANHVRMVRGGRITATATPLHLGGHTHVWDIRVRDEDDELVAVSRLTMAVLER